MYLSDVDQDNLMEDIHVVEDMLVGILKEGTLHVDIQLKGDIRLEDIQPEEDIQMVDMLVVDKGTPHGADGIVKQHIQQLDEKIGLSHHYQAYYSPFLLQLILLAINLQYNPILEKRTLHKLKRNRVN